MFDINVRGEKRAKKADESEYDSHHNAGFPDRIGLVRLDNKHDHIPRNRPVVESCSASDRSSLSLSRVFPLEPGDVLATGSPPGPGMYHDPPILAQVGDVMRIEIEKIGTLANPGVAANALGFRAAQIKGGRRHPRHA